jgi:formylglycine-generating enzyme required for sulfatase activity/energy-coupling factor transporter ATP-binding protein EcfA2
MGWELEQGGRHIMQRPFDQQTWKSRIAEWWRSAAQDLPGTMEKLGVRTAYGTLTASAWLPFLTAYGNDPGQAVAVLVTILSGVGTNLVSNLVQGAYDETTAPQSAEQEVAERTELRAEYQQMLAGLDVLSAAQGALGEQWAAFETRLQEELVRMGGGLRIDTGGGAVVFGNVVVTRGDFIGGNQIFNIYPSSPADDVTPLREAYLRHLESRCGRLPLRGVDVQAGDPTAQREYSRLARVYIHLDTTAAVGGEGKGKRRTGLLLEAEAIQRLERGEVSEVRRLSALETAVSNRRLVLLGAPGSGKSTFVRHLALCLVKAQLEPQAGWMEHLPGWPAHEIGALPVVVILRDFARWATGKKLERGTAQALGDFIAARLQEHDLADFVQPLREALHRGETIVLLDGLDEVPTKEQRGLVRDAVDDFACIYGKSRLLVTCRTLSYQDRAWQLIAKQFPAFELAPFDEEKIDHFIGAWYAELADLGAVRSEDVNPLADKLRRAVRRPDLWRLAPNPLLLTVMALVHAHRGRLPEARALLYEECTDLLLWRWEQVKLQAERDRLPGLRQLLAEAGLQDIDLKQVLWALAFEVHGATGGDDEEATADIPEADLLQALRKLHPQRSWDWAAKVVGQIKERAGLLIEREPEVYAFPHRTFQEYLAGCHLSVQADFAPQAASLLGEAAFWRQVVLLAVGRQVHVSGELARPLALVAELCPADEPADERGWRRGWLAGEVLLEAGVERAARSAQGRDLLVRVRDRLVALLETGHLAPRERAEAGDVLGKLGDPRPGVGIVVGTTGRSPLPDIVWCEVPAGSFLMGSTEDNKRAHDDERPQHTLTLPGFHISRYPITNAQYGTFWKAGGYDKPLYWTENGWGWRTGEREADLSVIDNEDIRQIYTDRLARRPPERRDCPFWWNDPSWNLSSRPVVGVSWYEALAFCAWLQEQIRRSQEQSIWRDGEIKICRFADSTVRLPSEAEWEKAARGGKGNEWPWGKRWAEGRANTREMELGATSAVGCFPAGASPCDALDMAGNVWEWTLLPRGGQPLRRAGHGGQRLGVDAQQVGREALQS